ncbi:MAG: cytochrome ubiquinol oxidase subunit I, partial [Acidobacteriota bacterium]
MKQHKFKILLMIGVVLLPIAVVELATFLNQRLSYQSPVDVEGTEQTPRLQGIADQQAEAAQEARDRPYEEVEYRQFPIVGSRVAVWVIAQLHLLFAAFVLAVPIFALIIEFIGYFSKDPKLAKRYDRLAHEFTKLLSTSFSLTATFGAFLLFLLIMLYPKFTNYLMSVFSA